MQDQFRQEARAALLSLLTGAAEESGATLRDIAARLGQGVTSCRTWSKLGSSGPVAMVAGGGAEGQGLGAVPHMQRGSNIFTLKSSSKGIPPTTSSRRPSTSYWIP